MQAMVLPTAQRTWAEQELLGQLYWLPSHETQVEPEVQVPAGPEHETVLPSQHCWEMVQVEACETPAWSPSVLDGLAA